MKGNHSRGSRIRARQFIAGAVLLLAGAALGVAGGADAAQPGPDGGPLTILPAAGTIAGTPDVRFRSATPCPPGPSDPDSSGHVVVVASGAGLPPNTILISPNPTTPDQQLAELGNTWDNAIANYNQSNDPDVPLPLNGTMTITLQCVDGDTFDQSFADFSGTILFNGAAGTYQAVGTDSSPSPEPTSGASPTPTPAPSSSPTPTPSPTPAPTSSASPSPTQSASPSPSPTGSAGPTPCVTTAGGSSVEPSSTSSASAAPTVNAATDTLSVAPVNFSIRVDVAACHNPDPEATTDVSSGGGGPLPGAGAQEPDRLLWLAALLIAAGTLCLAGAVAEVRPSGRYRL